MTLNKVIENCVYHSFFSLFPEKIDNKLVVYAINIIHLIGILIIQIGLLLPPSLLKFYIIYLIVLFTTYIMLNNQCFMTLLSNYYSKKNFNAMCIKMIEARFILGIYLLLAIFFCLYPTYAPFNILVKLLNIKISK